MDISLAKLLQIATIARTGSFSSAASELNISQPALSRSIATLEKYYGFLIFDRVGHGVRLTAAGKQALELAGPALQSLQVLDSNLRLFSRSEIGTLSIGFAPLLASQLLARFSAEFFSLSSRTRLQVMTRPGSALVNGLLCDEIESCFYPEGYIEPTDDIEVRRIGAMMPVCVVRKGHPLTAKKRIVLADLEEYPWASSIIPTTIGEALKPPQFICDNYHILRDAVLESDLISICSSTFVAPELEAGSLVAISVKGLPLPPTDVYSAKLRGRIDSPLAEEAVARVEKLLKR